ncbi:SAM-dependent methyltransferase [Rhodococcus sp. 077-4]|uniref:SAM-dependent methyltransferase n=1 Tax=Rhodococcus sp. 077-4 TaxID=2789271 RepID=UPI0039F625D1
MTTPKRPQDYFPHSLTIPDTRNSAVVVNTGLAQPSILADKMTTAAVGQPNSVPSRTALEFDFPALEFSRLAQVESWRKELYRPATSTHKWWAKRLGGVFRAMLVSSLVETSSDAMSVFSKKGNFSHITVFDPFAGSGTTAVESVKCGAKAISFDINPVASLVQRQALQSWDQQDLETSFKIVEDACRPFISELYSAEDGRPILYFFWVATTKCPVCEDDVNLLSRTTYARHAYTARRPAVQVVCPECLAISQENFDFVKAQCPNGHSFIRNGPVSGATMTCRNHHQTSVIDALNGNIPNYKMYAKLVGNPDGKRVYEPITEWDRKLYERSQSHLETLEESAVLPVGELRHGVNTRQPLKWNFRFWDQFFNARQLVSLSKIATSIRDITPHSPEREAMATLFSGSLEFNNRFTTYKGEGTGAVRGMFANHVLRPERTPIEANPWGVLGSSGGFSSLMKSRLGRAYDYKIRPVDIVIDDDKIAKVSDRSHPIDKTIVTDWESFEDRKESAVYISTGDSASTDIPDKSVNLVLTDPPYVDSVNYAELADFFHAWLRQIGPHEEYPTKANSTRNPKEVQQNSAHAFGEAVYPIWMECERVLRDDGLIAFTFHHSKLLGWVELTKSLHQAGIVVTSIQPIKGEMSSSVVKLGALEPFNLDSIVVCRKRTFVTAQWDSVELLYERALARLKTLLDSDIKVGRGDVRSVVRGTLLQGVDLGSSADLSNVERLTNRAIAELLDE